MLAAGFALLSGLLASSQEPAPFRRLGEPVKAARGGDVDFSPDGARLALAGADGGFTVHDARAPGTPRAYAFARTAFRADSVRISPDGRSAVCAYNGEAGGGHVAVWDLDRGEGRLIGPGREDVFQVEFSPDGARLARVDRSGIRILAIPEGTDLVELKLPGLVAFSADGLRLTSVAGDGRTARWELPSGAPIFERQADPRCSRVLGLAPGADLALVATPERGLALKGLADGSWTPLPGEAKAGAFSPDGRLVALGSGVRRDVRVLELCTGLEAFRLEGLPARPMEIRFSGDFRRLAVALEDRTAVLADLAAPAAPGPEQAWTDLGAADAAAAHRAMRAVSGGPPELLAALAGRLAADAAPAPPERAVRVLQALEWRGDAAARALLKRLAETATAKSVRDDAARSLERGLRRPRAD